MVFCTLAEDNDRRDWSAQTHDRHKLTTKIEAVHDPKLALLGYLQNKADMTNTLIRDIEGILEHDDRELEGRIKPRWLTY